MKLKCIRPDLIKSDLKCKITRIEIRSVVSGERVVGRGIYEKALGGGTLSDETSPHIDSGCIPCLYAFVKMLTKMGKIYCV